MRKKFFSILICTAMALGISTIVALADDGQEAAIGETRYGTLQEAIEHAEDGDTITVLRDIVLTKDTTVKIAPESKKSITIDLNQKKISYSNDGESKTAAISVDKPVALNIKNGRIDAGDDEHAAIRITCSDASSSVDLTISDSTINAGYADVWTDISGGSGAGRNRLTFDNVTFISSQYGVNAERADITFKSGSITTTGDETFYLDDCSLTVNAGKLISKEDACIGASGSELNIKGGMFESGDDYAIDLYKSKALIDGGVFKGPDGAFDAYESGVTLGENSKAVYSDGTDLDDFLNSSYVEVIKTVAKVTFIDGGRHVAEVLVRRGQSISGDDLTDESMPGDPEKEGYLFRGWRTAENGSGDAFTGATVVNDDLTVYAYYERKKGSVQKTDSDKSGSKTGMNLPKTGDDSSFYIWSALLIISVIAMIGIMLFKKKDKCIRR